LKFVNEKAQFLREEISNMFTITFVKKTPASPLGDFNWEYKCKSGTDKPNVIVSSANESEAKQLAQQECDETCGET
jgi:hypothetical protein